MQRIKPYRVESWPELFWQRSEASFEGHDLECRQCQGDGLDIDADERPVVCPACHGSGLIIPRREPATVNELVGNEPAWSALSESDLAWPQVPLAWIVGVAGLRQFRFARCERGVVGWVQHGRVLLGLMEWTNDARKLLLAAYREALGSDAEEIQFVIPRRRP